jgi:hypothetical protein
MPFIKVQKVVSKRMVADECAYSFTGLQTIPGDGNVDFFLSYVSAEEFSYQSQLCIWLNMKLHIFGRERAVSFLYVMMFTALGE